MLLVLTKSLTAILLVCIVAPIIEYMWELDAPRRLCQQQSRLGQRPHQN